MRAPLMSIPMKFLSGNRPGQPHGVFPLAAAQLEHYGVVIAEEIGPPLSLERESLLLKAREGILQHTGELLHLCEFT